MANFDFQQMYSQIGKNSAIKPQQQQNTSLVGMPQGMNLAQLAQYDPSPFNQGAQQQPTQIQGNLGGQSQIPQGINSAQYDPSPFNGGRSQPQMPQPMPQRPPQMQMPQSMGSQQMPQRQSPVPQGMNPQVWGQPAQSNNQGPARMGGQNLGFGNFQQPQFGPNPYLGQQANAITQNVTQNLQNNVLPGINSGAMAAGGFGGSRQGIAQGLAIQGANRDIANAQANMYGQAYTADQANQTQYGIAGMNNQTTQRGQDLNQSLGYAGLANTKDIASMQNQTTMRGQDLQNSLGYAGLANQKDIAGMQNQTSLRGQDLNFGLGMAQNDTTQRGQNLNYSLGQQQNQTTQRGQDLNYGLGQQQNWTTQRGQDLQNQLGNRNADISSRQVDNTYNLGLGDLNYRNANLDANIYQNNFNNQLNSAKFATDVYGQMMDYGQRQIGNSTTQYQLPLQYQNFFNGAYNAAGGQGGTTTETKGTTSNPMLALAGMFGYGAKP